MEQRTREAAEAGDVLLAAAGHVDRVAGRRRGGQVGA
jgi:hypothetical protein